MADRYPMSAHLVLTKIRNLATNMDLPLPLGKPAEVVDCGDKSLSFVTTKIAAQGQVISLTGVVQNAEASEKFEATGTIAAMVEQQDGLFRFEVQLSQYNKSQWKHLLQLLQNNQNRADAIFASIRREG